MSLEARCSSSRSIIAFLATSSVVSGLSFACVEWDFGLLL